MASNNCQIVVKYIGLGSHPFLSLFAYNVNLHGPVFPVIDILFQLAHSLFPFKTTHGEQFSPSLISFILSSIEYIPFLNPFLILTCTTNKSFHLCQTIFIASTITDTFTILKCYWNYFSSHSFFWKEHFLGIFISIVYFRHYSYLLFSNSKLTITTIQLCNSEIHYVFVKNFPFN